jgi:hypothetical protein
MYNNLAIYESALSEAKVLNHYLLYTGNIVNTVNDTSMTILEATTGNNFTPFTLTSVESLSISL